MVQFFDLESGSAVAGPALRALRRRALLGISGQTAVGALLLAVFGLVVTRGVFADFGAGAQVGALVVLNLAIGVLRVVTALVRLGRLQRVAAATSSPVQADLWWKKLVVSRLAGRNPVRKLAYLSAPGPNTGPYWAVIPKATVGDLASVSGTAVLVFGGRGPRSLVLIVSAYAAVVGSAISLEEAAGIEGRVSLGKSGGTWWAPVAPPAGSPPEPVPGPLRLDARAWEDDSGR